MNKKKIPSDNIFQTVFSYDEFQDILAQNPFVLLYASRPGCGVCTALKPKIAEIITEIPSLKGVYADLEELPMLAGQLSLFAVPVMAVFADGKESFREARNVSVQILREKLERIERLMC